MIRPMKQLLTQQQLAEELNVSSRTVRNWTTRRIIPAIRVGRLVRYDISKVKKALEAFETKALADALS